MIKDVECPYCGKWQEINHDDGYGYEEDELHEQQCYSCEKYFVYTTYISFSYTAYEADCLNGEEHKYKITHTIPREYTKMRCKDCGCERQLAEDERIYYGIDKI